MEELLTVADVAKVLKLSPRRVHALVREGKLGCVQHSAKHRAFLPEHVEAYIRSRTVTPPPNVVDTDRQKTVPSPAHASLKSEGGSSVRALLREEMRSWR